MPLNLPGLDNQLPGLRLPSLPGVGQRSASRMPLSDEDRQSVGQHLLGITKGVLPAILDATQMPGDYIRGGLAGKFGERVTGKQLNAHLGLFDNSDNGWGAWGAGLGTDILTDPLTYATFGAHNAFTKGGAALSRAGHLTGPAWTRKALMEGFHGTESNLLRGGTSLDSITHLRNTGKRIASPQAEADFFKATGQTLQPNQGLSTLGKWSVPFNPQHSVNFGSGKLAQRFAGGVDKAADYARYGNSLGRFAGSLFTTPVHRAQEEFMQKAWAQGGHALVNKFKTTGQLHSVDFTEGLNKIIDAAPHDEIAAQRAYRIALENAPSRSYLAHGLPADLVDPSSPRGAQIKALADASHAQFAQMPGRAREAGAPIREEANRFGLRYGPRVAMAAQEAGTGLQLKPASIVPTTSGANFHRMDPLRDNPGGTDFVNSLVNDWAGNPNKSLVRKQVAAGLEADYRDLTGLSVGPMTQDVAEHFYGAPAKINIPKNPAKPAVVVKPATPGKVKELSKLVMGLDEAKYRGKIDTHPYFSHNAGLDITRRHTQEAQTLGSTATAIKAAAAVARPASEFAKTGVEHVTIPQLFKRIGLESYSQGHSMTGALPRFAEARAKEFGPLGTITEHPFGPVNKGQKFPIENMAGEMAVSAKHADAIAKQFNPWQGPTELSPFWKHYDSFTNAFKSLAYPIWLASHVRNVGSAALNNARTGTSFRDYGKQLQFMTGKLSPAETSAMRRTQVGYANIGRERGINSEISGVGGQAARQSGRKFSEPTPLADLTGPHHNVALDTANLVIKEGALSAIPQAKAWFKSQELSDLFHPPTGPTAKPLLERIGDAYRASPVAIAGVGGSKVDRLAPVAAGRQVGSRIEEFMRGAQMNGLVRHGYSPEEAGRLVNKHHFAYDDLTHFEKTVGRRAVPFYTYSRKNLPLQLETLATRPGAFAAPFKPAQVGRGDQGDNYVPDYLANQFAMPLGPEVNGQRRYLSTLGLPQEEAFGEMSLWNGHPDLQSTAMRYAGNLNPLIKGGIEQLTDTQLYSGRKLSELHPLGLNRILQTMGSDQYAQPLSQLIANSPLTRFATTGDKLLDTQGITPFGRKPPLATLINLATGARITDIDVQRQKILEQRKAVNQLLSQQPHVKQYTENYIPKDQKKLASPYENLLERYFVDYQQQAKAHMEQQRRQQGMTP